MISMNSYEFDIKRFGRVLPESVTVEAEGEAIARDKARSEYLRKGEYLGDLRGMIPMDNQPPADTRLRWSTVSSTEINKAILCGLFRAESEVSYSEGRGWVVTFYNLTLQQIRRLAELTNGGKIDS